MAAAKTASKKAVEGQRVWKHNGKVVKPVLYNGHAIGHGKYLACEIDGVMQLDENGKPLPFRSIGKLVDGNSR